MKELSVGVLGAGAIGAFVGARIGIGTPDSGKVVLVGRSTLNDQVAANAGKVSTRLLDAKGKQDIQAGTERFVVTKDLAELKSCQVIIISVKSGLTQEVSKSLAETLGNESGRKVIVSLQNGVENARLIHEQLGEHHDVIPGMVEFNVVWEENAFFNQQSSGKIFMGVGSFQKKGGLPNEITPEIQAVRDDILTSLSNCLQKGGLPNEITPEIEAVQRGKLCVNLINAINGLAGVPILKMVGDRHFRRVLAACTREAIGVFKGAKMKVIGKVPIWIIPVLYSLPGWIFSLITPFVIKVNPDAKTSMLQDLENFKKTEISIFQGYIVELARSEGLPEPKVNKMIVELIQKAEQEGNGPPKMTGLELRKACGL